MFLKKRVYLDTAAGVSANSSSPHEEGRRAKTMLEEARTRIARLVEVQSDDVIFTSGATESNALAILGVVRARRLSAGPDAAGRNNIHVLYLSSAHALIVENIKLLASEGVSVEALPIENYRVDTAALAKMIRPETALVTMDAICGETGVVWNTREVAEVLAKSRRGNTTFSLARGTAATREENGIVAPLSQPVAAITGFRAVLHVDASQAPWSEKVTRAHFDADLLTLDASKVAPIRGIGALIAHRTIALVPLYRGGGQERGLRPGSEAPELAEVFAANLGAAASGRESFRTSAQKSRAELTATITKAIPNVLINEGRAQTPHILNLSLPGRDTDYLVALLDEAGFATSTRSACETDSQEGSRAVFVLTRDADRARATLRISWGPQTSPSELNRFVKALIHSVAFIDNNSLG